MHTHSSDTRVLFIGDRWLAAKMFEERGHWVCLVFTVRRTCPFKSFRLWLSHELPQWSPKKKKSLALHCQGKGHQQLRAHDLGEVGERENETSTTPCSLFMMKTAGFHPKTSSPLLPPLLNTAGTLMRRNLAVSAISRDKHQNIKLCFPLFCKIWGFRIASLNVCPTPKLWGMIFFFWQTLGIVLIKDLIQIIVYTFYSLHSKDSTFKY